MAAKTRAQKSMERITLYQTVFNSEAGRAVLNDMMSAHGMLSPHPLTVNEMMAKEGERMVVLRILTFLKTNPDKLKQRMEEYDRSLE